MSRNTNGKGSSLKDTLFNKEKVQYLADLFSSADATFSADTFMDEVMKDMLSLELKQRIVCIAKALEKQLPDDFVEACSLIVSALPEPLEPAHTDNDFGDFIFAPLGEYVVRNGRMPEYVDISLTTLQEITMRFSMEDAIRYFINEFQEETMDTLQLWVDNENYHVRRLVSEGTRPLLPWSRRISLGVTSPLQFLEILHADNTRYVTRSVANHMNDISKIEPHVVVASLYTWRKQGIQEERELEWMTRHALRTLLKQGHKGALKLLGYHTKPKITVQGFALSPDSKKIIPGDSLAFTFDVIAHRAEKLMIDYVIDFLKANGGTKPKVFKLKKIDIQKGETVSINKKHQILADTTTRTLYPGTHTVTLQINGQKLDTADFVITSVPKNQKKFPQSL